MSKTDHDPIGPGFEWRLKAALDRVTPPSSNPRYAATAMGGARTWPAGPALLAAGAAMVLLAVTATAATGSPNPAVWAERAGSTIQSVSHPSETVPSPEPSPERPLQTPHSAVPAQPTHDEHEPEATQTPDPAESKDKDKEKDPAPRPEPSEAPDHAEDHSGPRLPETPPPS